MDAVIIVALVTLFWCAHRFLEEVEFGGDAIEKWHFVRQWFYDNDFSHVKWTHHMARVGVNAWVWLAQALLGRGWQTYYVVPFAMAAAQIPFVYLLARKLGGRLAGLIAVLSISYLAMVHRSASQLLPDGIAGTYAIVACYLCVRFLEASDATRRRFLIALGLVAFCGYLAKETFFFFFPGLGLAVWSSRRSWRDAATFFGILLTGLLLETLAYAVLTEHSSRLAIVLGTHLAAADGDDSGEKMRFVDVFQRFDELHNATKYLLFFGLASALWLAVLRRPHDARARAVVLSGLSHVLFLTFLVKSLRPLDLFQGFDPRYMEPATPFLGVYVGTFLADVASTLWSSTADAGWLQKYGPGAPGWAQGAWSLGAIAALACVTVAHQRSHPPLDGFARGRELSSVLERAYQRNLPILERSERGKVLRAVYSVYLDDRLLARDGKLPELHEVELSQRRMSALVKDPSQYGKATLAKLIGAGCFVEVKRGPARNPGTRDRRASIAISATPPSASCDALLAGDN